MTKHHPYLSHWAVCCWWNKSGRLCTFQWFALVHSIAYLGPDGVCWLERKREKVEFSIHRKTPWNMNSTSEVWRSLYVVISQCLSAVNDSCKVIIADPLKSQFLVKRKTKQHFFTELNFPYTTFKTCDKHMLWSILHFYRTIHMSGVIFYSYHKVCDP